MFAPNDSSMMEYVALTSRSRSVERTGQWSWVISALAAAVLFAWAVRSGSPALMLPVVLCAAVGYHSWIRARQQVRLIAGYLEESFEGRSGGPQWHARLAQVQSSQAANPSEEWLVTGIANLVVVAAIACSWMSSDAAKHGELFAGFVTALGVIFAFHSVTETARLAQADYFAMWRKAGTAAKEMERPRSSAA